MKRYLIVFTLLMLMTVVCTSLCTAKVTYDANNSRITPAEVLEKNRDIIDRYKEIAAKRVPQILRTDAVTPSPPATEPAPSVIRTPTSSILPVTTFPSPIGSVNGTVNATGEPVGVNGEKGFSVPLIMLLVFLGAGFLHTTILMRNTRSATPFSPERHFREWAGGGIHALLALLFFIQVPTYLRTGLSAGSEPGNGDGMLVVGAFLIAYGAVSSAGMAYCNFRGIQPGTASYLHIGVLAVGFLASAAALLVPVFPGPSPVLPLLFLSAVLNQLIQMMRPGDQPVVEKAPYSDTMLFEDDPTPAIPLFPPELEQRYLDARFLHQGGIARVFSAKRRDDGTLVAVKVPIKTDEQTGRSLLREMSVWRSLVHPGIVEVYAANILPVPFVEMEYLPKSLADITLPLDPLRAAEIFKKIAIALAYAHGKGVIHRDLKPGNILLSDTGEPKIGDWGLARNDLLPSETTLHGFSLSYAAPEQLDPGQFGRTTERTDIYQLGIIFYQLLTGMLPFTGESVGEVFRERLSAGDRPHFHAPPAGRYDHIIDRCLAVNPDARYQTIRDLIADLDSCEKDQGNNQGDLLKQQETEGT